MSAKSGCFLCFSEVFIHMYILDKEIRSGESVVRCHRGYQAYTAEVSTWKGGREGGRRGKGMYLSRYFHFMLLLEKKSS